MLRCAPVATGGSGAKRLDGDGDGEVSVFLEKMQHGSSSICPLSELLLVTRRCDAAEAQPALTSASSWL